MTDVPAGCPLTPRQLELVTSLSEGLGIAGIAEKHGVTRSTASSIIHDARKRLGVTTSAQALALVLRNGWVEGVSERSGFTGTYLAAFDEHLQSGSRESRRAMRCALMGMQAEKGLDVTVPRKSAGDPLDRLLRHVLGRP